MLRQFLRALLRWLYKFRAYNESVLSTPGPVLLLPNHLSWWDWVLVGVCLEDDWKFVTSSTSAELSWLHKKIMVNLRTFPVDINSPYAVKRMAEYLQSGGRLVLFPEGRISMTGSLMKLFDGTGFLIQKTGARVITAYLRGAARLPFSRNPDQKFWFPTLSVHFSEILAPPAAEHVSATEARTRLTNWLRDQMTLQRFETEMRFGAQTVSAAIYDTAREFRGRVALQDVTLQELTYGKLTLGANLMARQWRGVFGDTTRHVGVLLPNINAFTVVLLSIWTEGKVPAILNYTTGPSTLLACARLAGLTHIITSRHFIARSKLDLEPLKAAGIQLIYLEDARNRISRAEKISAALRQALRWSAPLPQAQATDTAVILFTSGSEGMPKGVELTHRNLLSNARQMLSVIDVTEKDRFFNALPLFHSFGLTVGLLLPLIRGIYTLLYPSPLHYRVVPSAFYNMNCTVFFGTNTFLSGYARKAHPLDFRSLRYLFAGAEKLLESTATVWMQKFGVRVLEGYGATECSPCVAANLPVEPRVGSVGRFLPGIEHRIERVEGIPEGLTGAGPGSGTERAGRLFVRGPNIMKGYLNPEANVAFQSLRGWYDTGDIVRVDKDGFLFILGRLKRFAKVSGEMVSLTAVEDALSGAFPQYGLRFGIAVVAKPDEAKGEKLVAVTNEPKLSLAEIRSAIQARGLGNLAVPREIIVVRELPRLGTGKIDHRALQEQVLAAPGAPR
jgi:acyl-[acyl-carrier-protein]-phospholipid O-acyltransferase/long-chain-fatty-acid--[acyl-carrier-protein] ligase